MSEHCVVCGAEIPEGRQVCPSCEKNLFIKQPIVKRCEVCGWEIPPTRNICELCSDSIRNMGKCFFRKKDKSFTAEEVCMLLIKAGQADTRFKWGDIIKYTPAEVMEILEDAYD